MDVDVSVPRIPLLVDRRTALVLNWVFTGIIIVGNTSVICLILGSEKFRKSSKYILVASLAFADLTDGGCFLPMWTDVLINLRIHFSCQARYLSGALGHSIACVCSLTVVSLNSDFTFRRAFGRYKGRIRAVVVVILLLVSWCGPFVTLEPIVASGMQGLYPVHCYFTIDNDLVIYFILLAFLIPSAAVVISTGFVIFVHMKTKESARPSANTDNLFPSDVVIIAGVTVLCYLSFGVLQLKTYSCNPRDCYFSFMSRFVVIGNLMYAKSAILPWIWLFSRGFRKEMNDMFCLTSVTRADND